CREQHRHQHPAGQDPIGEERVLSLQQSLSRPDFDLPFGSVEIQQGFLPPLTFVLFPSRGPVIEFFFTIEYGNPIARRDVVKSGTKEVREAKGPKQEAIELTAHEEGYRNLESCSVLTEAESPCNHSRAVPTDQFQGLPSLFFEPQIKVLRLFIARQRRN